MLSHACGGLLLDPGLGKTSISYAAYTILKRERLASKVLVIAPLRPAYSVWPKEGRKWAEFNKHRVVVLHGPDKDAILKRMDFDVAVINPEGLPWLFSHLQKFKRPSCTKKFPFDMLIVDESSKFKHTGTVRFKTLRPFIYKFRRRYILTGTPAPNGLLNLFGQMYIIDQGRRLGAYFTNYRASFFYPAGVGGYSWVIRDDAAEKKIHKLIQDVVIRMDEKDHLKLPPLVINDVMVDLPDPARQVYDQMEVMLLTSIDSDLVVAQNSAVASGKCRQIANGGVYTDSEQKVWRKVHDVKTEAVIELVNELNGKPALIAYEFKHDLARLKKALGENTPHIGSGVSPKRALQIEDDWNAGRLPVLLVHPSSVAHGLNLQDVGSAVIWHSLTWDLENYWQLIKRVWRSGQKSRVVVHRVIARNTVDMVIRAALKKKDHTQRSLLDALRTYTNERIAAGALRWSKNDHIGRRSTRALKRKTA